MHKKIGIALGSGAARGLCHFGVINALYQNKVIPEVVCGTSMGALVGAAYVTGHLNQLRDWFKAQSKTEMLRHLDFSIFSSGGLADGDQFIHFLKNRFGDYRIEDLKIPFAAVACDLHTGKEVWLTEGSIWDAVRASGAYPGLLTPVEKDKQWLVDGGIVNPVPVSVCKALGASHVIGVNLNHDLLTPRMKPQNKKLVSFKLENPMFDKVSGTLKRKLADKIPFSQRSKSDVPSILEVISGTVNIMQDRITRSRLSGDPADLLLTPKLSHIGFLETEKAEQIIAEGERCVLRNIDQLSLLK